MVLVAAPLLLAQSVAVPVPPVVVTQGKYGPYYHVPMELRAEDVIFAQSDRQVRDGGQFDIRIRASRFPIPAPSCRGALVLRMPWTSSRQAGAATSIRAKEELLRRIRALESNPSAVVPVVIELNPYVRVVSRSPLRLQLTGCNVFFRHAAGAYVDHVDADASRR